MQTGPTDFVVVYESGTMRVRNGAEISHMLDLADCDACDGVAGIYAVNEKNELVKIRVGRSERDPEYSETSSTIIYAYAPIFAGDRRVGTLAMTDH